MLENWFQILLQYIATTLILTMINISKKHQYNYQKFNYSPQSIVKVFTKALYWQKCTTATTILYKTHWDTCSTNHHYIHNQDVWVQNDMYNSISIFLTFVFPLPFPPAAGRYSPCNGVQGGAALKNPFSRPLSSSVRPHFSMFQFFKIHFSTKITNFYQICRSRA